MTINIPVILHDNLETLTVDYTKNAGPAESGFDALDIPFPAECCIGYPTVHAYFDHMNATGYKRYCGFIQFIQRVEYKNGIRHAPELFIDVDDYSDRIGNPYFSYGFPASLYDAPCKNLGACDYLEWSAFTYLVDMPTRMNENRLRFITGFSWGYDENNSDCAKLHELKMLTETQFKKHYHFIPDKYSGYTF